MFATIYVLCYGDYAELHRRVMNSLSEFLPRHGNLVDENECRVVVWCNQVSSDGLLAIRSAANSIGHCKVIQHHGNMPKYQVMRTLWRTEDTRPKSKWVLWLDDDTYITKPDWWAKTRAFLGSTPDACYVGQRWYVHHLEGQWDFIKAAKWFKGAEPEMLPTRKKGVKKPGIWFMTGGYVWLKTDLIDRLDWPDERLVHNGGDTLLGEAVRQQGLPRHRFDYGVAVNKAKRRGRSDRPAGTKHDVRR